MSRLTRDGTGEPVSRDQAYGDRGIFIFPVQLATSRIGNLTRLINTLLWVMTIHKSLYVLKKKNLTDLNLPSIYLVGRILSKYLGGSSGCKGKSSTCY